jgi:hypothetical protein
VYTHGKGLSFTEKEDYFLDCCLTISRNSISLIYSPAISTSAHLIHHR